ncbi:MAG: hypothetical protein HYX76_09475 [Acidobacteria bacterium]|nr:hypothetical protein [Acidobacteriota bacterium]
MELPALRTYLQMTAPFDLQPARVVEPSPRFERVLERPPSFYTLRGDDACVLSRGRL